MVKKARTHTVMFTRKPLNNSPDQLAKHLAQMSLKDSVPITKFEEMGLKPELLKGIKEYGSGVLREPAYCQQRVIVPITQGRDVLCQAQSGMGKTASFCIGLLQRVDPLNPRCQVLVLAPTRELAEQIHEVFTKLGKHLKGVNCLRCVGGTSGRINKAALENARNGGKAYQIAVGTMGRVYNLLKDDFIYGDDLQTLVIDEADKMISDYSIKNDMQHVIGSVSATAQMIVMSATMPPFEIQRTQAFMRNPLQVLVKSDQLTLDGIQQFYINVETEDRKLENLSEIYPFVNNASGIVFCNSRARAEKVNSQMQDFGHTISDMVGTMEPAKRTNTLRNFRAGKVPVLIASDLLGRGIDVDHVKLVINYDLPEPDQITQYIHRVGRAGRYGKKGVAITFITDSEKDRLADIETYYKTSITPMPRNINELLQF